jgi:broad specificity phosphatase PhoE
MSETINDDGDDNLLPKGVDSLSDYTPNKLHLLLTLPIPVDIAIFQEPSPINFDNSQKKLIANKSSKKRNLFRYLVPISLSPLAHNEQDKYHQAQPPIQPIDPYDMRFFIIRHGERVDRYFGSNWYLSAFDQHDQYCPYHRNFPLSLPYRSNKYLWALDTPLTLSGLNAAKKLGQKIGSKYFQPTYVYSSPAMRCILTTIQILKGLGLDNQIAIRIEPGLLEIGASKFGMKIFYQPMEWLKFGVNIDLSYQPIMTHVSSFESEDTYYLRSKYVIREIENHHNKSPDKIHNILIIAHATSPETLTWDLVGKQPNVNDLYRNSLYIAYLQMVIIERKQDNQFWSLKRHKWF